MFRYAFTIFLLFVSAAQASTATSGKILQLDVATAGNLPFRVYLEGLPILCTGGIHEGYIDDSDANYKIYVAALMLAKATGATVTLFSDIGLYGRCKVTYLSVK